MFQSTPSGSMHQTAGAGGDATNKENQRQRHTAGGQPGTTTTAAGQRRSLDVRPAAAGQHSNLTGADALRGSQQVTTTCLMLLLLLG